MERSWRGAGGELEGKERGVEDPHQSTFRQLALPAQNQIWAWSGQDGEGMLSDDRTTGIL